MAQRVQYEVHPKEKLYFTLKVIFSGIIYVILAIVLFTSLSTPQGTVVLTGILFYAAIIMIIILFSIGLLIGHLKGNAVKITADQFPDIYDIVRKQSEALRLSTIPQTYILQSGGLLNAFATKFLGRNYIVIYSEILEEAYENNLETVEFVIAHELGHVQRNHITKNMLLFPSAIVPFLQQAYSRGCEYTCDRIGAALSPKGVVTGLTVLAAGKKLYKKVNVDAYVAQNRTEAGFWPWIAEKLSTHPKLTKRVAEFANRPEFTPAAKPAVKEEVKEHVSNDHSKYMPGM